MHAAKLTKQHWLLIFTLSLLTFVLGTSEFVIVGILTDIANSLGISNAKAGVLVSAFAITFAVATPAVMSTTSHYPKRKWMLLLIAAFILLNLACVFTSSYALLMVFRMLTAIATGVLISLAMVVASESVPEAQRGLAISFVFGGFTLANVIGVPLGTFVAGHFNWHATFVLTTALGICALLSAYMVLPSNLSQERGSIKDQVLLLVHPRIMMAFFIPALGFGALYTVYTYLVPILKGMGAASESISVILFAYGLISIFSNILAGKIASHNGIGRLRFVFLIQAAVLGALYLTTGSYLSGMINIGLMSLTGILLTTSTQLYLIDLAGKYQPSATGLAASLMPVASNVGIAFGSALGGIVYEQAGLLDVTWAGAAVALAASVLTFVSYHMDQRNT
ncbi:MFS transporter [Fictibacillus iocasae]|uniref:MFS transporter n=1 Tax=Fictibacillus iocasae TaxID=2715437 RepID=A0ABW2NU83_9BACL